MFMGVTANGSERWIPLAFGFQLQPSEIAKISAILLMAQATSQGRLITPILFRNLALVAVMIFLIYQQPSLSISMIVSAITAIMLFVGGVPLFLFVGGAPFVLYGLYHKIKGTEYQWKRIVGWLSPWEDPQGTGYNLIQSYFAVGSGGLLGMGFGRSVQKMYYLPFHHTDFIFSIICEEMGFLGAFILISMFVLLAWRGFFVALRCPSRFGQMLALGITCAITLQMIINISVTIGLMPVTGVTLPLISYGGTSMVITLAMIGILINISRYELRYTKRATDFE
jgi:cell division protein FtsW